MLVMNLWMLDVPGLTCNERIQALAMNLLAAQGIFSYLIKYAETRSDGCFMKID